MSDEPKAVYSRKTFSGSNFFNWDVPSDVTVVDNSGPSYKKQAGNSFSEQSGDSISLQFGNKNSFQHGISNSALVGLSFSTNVAMSTSTFLGAKFSFELAASATVSAAAKFTLNKSREYIYSHADKYTLHGGGGELNAKKKEESANEAKKAFITQVDEWYVQHSTVIQSKTQKIMKGAMEYGELTTTVATNDTKTVVNEHEIMAARHTFDTWARTSKLEIDMTSGVSMQSISKVTINGVLIKIG
jgi:hypothetical protein